MNIKKILASSITSVAIFSIAFAQTFAATTTIVTGNTSSGENTPGWLFNRDVSTSTPYEFNNTASSIGSGSLYVLPIGANASDKFIGENFINAPISTINSISYDFKIGAGGVDTEEEQFYMNVYANFGISDDLKFYDCRYSVVPTVGSVSGFTTVTFDPTIAYPVATRGGASASPFVCPAIPAEMDLASAGSNIRVFSLNLGDTSTSDQGLDGYFDNVVVNSDSEVAISDFEQATLPPTNKNQCKNDGWMTFNNPAFNNKKECEKYVKDHKKDGKAEGSLQLSGPKQKIKFEVSEKDDDHKDNKVEYWNYEYLGVLHYKAKAMCVNVDKTTKEARFMFQIPEGYPGLSGMFVVSYVKEVKHGADLYGHSATADEATAKAWCETGVGFSPSMYSVTKGEVEVE